MPISFGSFNVGGGITHMTNAEGDVTQTITSQSTITPQEEAKQVILPEGSESDTRALREIQDELVKDAPSISLVKQLLKNMKMASPQLLKIAFNIFSNPLTALALSYDLFMKEE